VDGKESRCEKSLHARVQDGTFRASDYHEPLFAPSKIVYVREYLHGRDRQVDARNVKSEVVILFDHRFLVVRVLGCGGFKNDMPQQAFLLALASE
jgi:hypothetical protein